MKCQECETCKHKELYVDPRGLPYDTIPCLCDVCYVLALDTVIDEIDDSKIKYLAERARVNKIIEKREQQHART